MLCDHFLRSSLSPSMNCRMALLALLALFNHYIRIFGFYYWKNVFCLSCFMCTGLKWKYDEPIVCLKAWMNKITHLRIYCYSIRYLWLIFVHVIVDCCCFKSFVYFSYDIVATTFDNFVLVVESVGSAVITLCKVNFRPVSQ